MNLREVLVHLLWTMLRLAGFVTFLVVTVELVKGWT